MWLSKVFKMVFESSEKINMAEKSRIFHNIILLCWIDTNYGSYHMYLNQLLCFMVFQFISKFTWTCLTRICTDWTFLWNMAKQYPHKTCCTKRSQRSAIHNMGLKIVLNATLQTGINRNRVNYVLQKLQRSKVIKICMIFNSVKKILKINCDTSAALFYAKTCVIILHFSIWWSI